MVARARVVDALVVATAIGAVVLGGRHTCAHARAHVLGVAPGMPVSEVRASFAPGAAGRFRASAGAVSRSIEWVRGTAERGALAAAELELRDGRLARIRLRFDASAGREDLRGLLGAPALETATVTRGRDGRLVATWDGTCAMEQPR